MIKTVDPRTGESLVTFEEYRREMVDLILEEAQRVQRIWRQSDNDETAACLRQAAVILLRDTQELAHLITLEMGELGVEAESEIEKYAKTFYFYVETARSFHADITVDSVAAGSRVLYEPLGTVLAIMPWNYPFWQFFRFVALALAAGNAAILKHTNNVPQCALRVEEVVREAGFPRGLVRTLLIGANRVAAIIADERIAAVTLTGSTEMESIVASQAGAVVKKQVFELGGSDTFIVLGDADIERAAVTARFTNTGQSCVNAKQFIVEDSVVDDFLEAFTAGVRALTVGDPSGRATKGGPMARGNLRAQLDGHMQRAVMVGAILRTGGHAIKGAGFYYEPPLIDYVLSTHVVFAEETFAPVTAITRVAHIDEAIRLAHLTQFGLGAAPWTNDLDIAESLARQIHAGAVSVSSVVASDPRLLVGGIQKFGYGWELGQAGIREFVSVKALSIESVREPNGERE